MQRKSGLICLLWKSCGPKQGRYVYAHFCLSLPLTQNESSLFYLLCQLLATHPYTLPHSQPIYCNPEDESSMSAWNTGSQRYDYTTSQSRRAKTVSECSQEHEQLAKFTLNKMTLHVLTTTITKPIHTHN